MKGAPYHFLQGKQNVQIEEQWVPVVVKSTDPLPECHGNNGPDGVNCARAVCSGTNGPHDGPNGTPCTLEEPAAIPHYNTDPVAGRPYATTGDTLPVGVRDLSGTTNPNSNLGNQSFAQWVPVVVKSTAPLPECHGNNGPDGVNCSRPVCSGTNGPHDGWTGTPCTLEEPAAIPHYNTDPLAGRPYATTGDTLGVAARDLSGTTNPNSNMGNQSFNQQSAPDAGYPEAEKVHVLDPKIARTHTTFYGMK